jgi:hypothetical protein
MASLSPAPSVPPETTDETIRRLSAELHEAQEQQAAVTEILDVINRSPGNLTPVFDAILDKAMALCEAAHGSMQLYDGQQFRGVAVRGLPEPLADLLRGGIRPSPEAPMWGLLKGDRFVHVPDLTTLDIPEVRFLSNTAAVPRFISHYARAMYSSGRSSLFAERCSLFRTSTSRCSKTSRRMRSSRWRTRGS